MSRYAWTDPWEMPKQDEEGPKAWEIDADHIEFNPGHVAFLNASGNLILAIQNDHCHDLRILNLKYCSKRTIHTPHLWFGKTKTEYKCGGINA